MVAGVRDRATGIVSIRHVPDLSIPTLTGLVAEHAEPGAEVFTDEWSGYTPLGCMRFYHQAVRHGVGQYVDGMAHTNGTDSFWAMLKRGYVGTYHLMSAEHLHRYVSEFEGRHHARPMDTESQMAEIVEGMEGRLLSYQQLIAEGPHAKCRMAT